MKKSKRILVTGGAGFLGSHLCERLLKAGHDVLCLDNFSTGTNNNVEHLLSSPRFKLLRHDVSLPLDRKLSTELYSDQIYNLACPASPVHYQSDPIQTMKTSVLGALQMLGLAKNNKARILQASTSEVYGDPEVHPQKESYWGHVNPVGIRACYDEGKRCAETLFFDEHRQSRLSIKVVRIFNTYGPRMRPDDGRAVSNFLIQALRNKPITIFGEGTQTRSFCYVEDLLDALLLMMQTEDDFLGPVNLGNPHEISVRELAEIILELTGSKSKLEFKPLPGDDPKQRCPDIELAKFRLGWQPTTDLKAGLLKTMCYFEKILGERS